MNTDGMQDNILQAVDYLVNNRVDRLRLDKTIIGVIVECLDATKGEYSISYNGGTIVAVAQEGKSYRTGQNVYVLVPENDFTKTKVILGISNKSAEDKAFNLVTDTLGDYDIIGKSLIRDPRNLQPFKVHSYMREECLPLYRRGAPAGSAENMLALDEDELNNTFKSAQGIYLTGEFMTRLPKEHQVSKTGIYGVQVVLGFKDGDKTLPYFTDLLKEMIYGQQDVPSSPLTAPDANVQPRETIDKYLFQEFQKLTSKMTDLWIKNELMMFSQRNTAARQALVAFKSEVDRYPKHESRPLLMMQEYSVAILQALDNKEIERLRQALITYKAQINVIWKDTTLDYALKRQKNTQLLQTLKQVLYALLPHETEFNVQELVYELGRDSDAVSKVYAYEPLNTAKINTTTKTFNDTCTSVENKASLTSVRQEIERLNGRQGPKVRYLSYVLDSDNMEGNPMLSESWTLQNVLFPIDIDRFLYVDSIVLFERGFVERDDLYQCNDAPDRPDDAWGADIFLQNLCLYGVHKNETVKDGYRLTLSTPRGSVYKGPGDLDIHATVLEKGIVDLSDSTTFFWFKRDNRITTLSKNYHAHAGVGWRWLRDKGSKRSIILSDVENKAYRNEYLCVAVYKTSIVLKSIVTLFNETARRNITITSSLGQVFSFDRGVPELICLIDGKSANFETDPKHPDSRYRFVWGRQDKETTNSMIFLQTQKELQDLYNHKIGMGASYNELSLLKAQITALDGISWDRNRLTCPVRQIKGAVTFSCSVYLRDREPAGQETIEDIEYDIGTATIELRNEHKTSPTDYNIEILGGSQVFQYNLAGVSPDDDRYADPLRIDNLEVRFTDPTGLEVNPKTYSVKWVVPLSDSMVVPPTQGMERNPSNDKLEWFTGSRIYPLRIAKNYDLFATNNQVEAVISYEGKVYSKSTNLTFTKVGDVGTNGTDIFAKIVPTSRNPVLQKAPLMLEVYRDGSFGERFKSSNWNTGQSMSDQVLTFELYQRNQRLPVDESKVVWTMAGGSGNLSKYMSVSNGVVSWDETGAERRMFRNQIVKATYRWEGHEYHAYYPIPVIYINWFNGFEYNKMNLVQDLLLKSILYNRDGHDPLYNKNQGVFIDLEDRYLDNGYSLDFYVYGGQPDHEKNVLGDLFWKDNPQHSSLSLINKRDSKDGMQYFFLRLDKKNRIEGVYILPNDMGNGQFQNHIVRVDLGRSFYAPMLLPEITFFVPIYVGINTYGLKSINTWDGSHIEINENENYILAPQIGAGEKDKENRFTGLVMGRAEFYDKVNSKGRVEADVSVGLLGYSHGEQSIFLDAETGGVTLGLPETSGTKENRFNEGRIKLIPGGTSYIGNWRIASRALYNLASSALDPRDNVKMDITIPYPDLDPKIYKLSIPYEAEGILLSSQPSYISVKGRMLEDRYENNIPVDVNFNAATSVVQPFDTFELQLDPGNPSIFTILRHTAEPRRLNFKIVNNNIYDISDTKFTKPLSKAILGGNRIIGWETLATASDGHCVIGRRLRKPNNSYEGGWYFQSVIAGGRYMLPEFMDDGSDQWKEANQKIFNKLIWRREPKVGINNQGRFYANALKDGTAAMGIGDVGAFGAIASEHVYAGAVFDVGYDATANSLIKFFTETATLGSTSGHLYISGATDRDDEYERPLSMHFDSVDLFCGPERDKKSEKVTENQMSLSSKQAVFGFKDGKLELYDTKPGGLTTLNDFTFANPNDRKLTMQTGSFEGTIKGNNKVIINEGYGTFELFRDLNVRLGGNYRLSTATFDVSVADTLFQAVGKNNLAFLKVHDRDNHTSQLQGEKLLLTAKRSGLIGESYNSGDGVYLRAYAGNGEDASGVTLRLAPQTGGSASIFSIQSPNGSIMSRPDAYNGWSGIVTSGFLNTKALIATNVINDGGGKPYDSTSVLAAMDVRSQNGRVWGRWLKSDISLTIDGKEMNKGWFEDQQRFYEGKESDYPGDEFHGWARWKGVNEKIVEVQHEVHEVQNSTGGEPQPGQPDSPLNQRLRSMTQSLTKLEKDLSRHYHMLPRLITEIETTGAQIPMPDGSILPIIVTVKMHYTTDADSVAAHKDRVSQTVY